MLNILDYYLYFYVYKSRMPAIPLGTLYEEQYRNQYLCLLIRKVRLFSNLPIVVSNSPRQCLIFSSRSFKLSTSQVCIALHFFQTTKMYSFHKKKYDITVKVTNADILQVKLKAKHYQDRRVSACTVGVKRLSTISLFIKLIMHLKFLLSPEFIIL